MIDNNSSHEKTVNYEVIGQADLKKIDSEYSIVPRSKSKFTDPVWAIIENDEQLNFYFDDYEFEHDGCRYKLGEPQFCAIVKYFKVRTCLLLRSENVHTGGFLAATTIYGAFIMARKWLIPKMLDSGALIPTLSKRNQFNIPAMSKFSQAHMNDLLDEIMTSDSTDRTKCRRINAIAKYTSEMPKLASYFRLPYNALLKQSVSSLFNQEEDDSAAWDGKSGYALIPEADYYWLGRSALDFVTEYAETITKIHKLVCTIQTESPPKNIIFKQSGEQLAQKANALNRELPTYRLVELIRRMKAQKIDFPHWTEKQLKYWDCPTISVNDVTNLTPDEIRGCGINWPTIGNLFRTLFGACETLIFIPTGMRLSEFRNISGDRTPDKPNSDGIYLYGNRIKKVKTGEMGYTDNEIPVPYPTWYAMTVLRDLALDVGGSKEGFWCLHPFSSTMSVRLAKEKNDFRVVEWYGKRASNSYVGNSLRAFASFIGCRTLPTSHQFRKTLASFFVSRTKQAPILLCQLFGHKSIGMTLKYLEKSKLIRREIVSFVRNKYASSVAALATAFVKNTLGGPMKTVFEKTVGERDNFKGLTEVELARDLGTWLLSKIASNKFLITHTPTNICCRPKASKDLPPCHQGQCGKIDPDYPIPGDCVGADCGWSIFTFYEADDLGKNLIYYQNLIATTGPSALQGQRMMAFATQYVETYDPIHKQITRIPVEAAETFMSQAFSSTASAKMHSGAQANE